MRPNDPNLPRDPNDAAPARLAIVGATDLERRLIASGAGERPSADVQRRMRAALGLSLAGTTLATAAVAKAGTSAGATSWLAAGAFAAVIAGGVVASLVTTRAPDAVSTAAKKIAPSAAATPAKPTVAAPATEPTAARATASRHRAAAPTADLRGEIALIDAARSANRAQAPDRALSLLDNYRRTYPHGEFSPEATVLRIEALDAVGRADEARGLARTFLAKHPDSPLSDRVARIARIDAR